MKLLRDLISDFKKKIAREIIQDEINKYGFHNIDKLRLPLSLIHASGLYGYDPKHDILHIGGVHCVTVKPKLKPKVKFEWEGCPCSKDCCTSPNVITPEHECKDSEDFCEECYANECLNCGKRCHCDL